MFNSAATRRARGLMAGGASLLLAGPAIVDPRRKPAHGGTWSPSSLPDCRGGRRWRRRQWLALLHQVAQHGAHGNDCTGAGRPGGMRKMPASKVSTSWVALSLSTVKSRSPGLTTRRRRLEPVDEDAFFHRPAQAGHQDLTAMTLRAPLFRHQIVDRLRDDPRRWAPRPLPAGGCRASGVAPLSRRTGASRSSKPRSMTCAAISAPMPQGCEGLVHDQQPAGLVRPTPGSCRCRAARRCAGRSLRRRCRLAPVASQASSVLRTISATATTVR